MKQFQHSEQTEQAQRSDIAQHFAAGNKEREIHGQYCQQVDNSVKTEYVLERLVDTVYPQNIFQCKQNGENPLGNKQFVVERHVYFGNGFEHDGYQAAYYKYQQYNVEQFARRRICPVYKYVDFLTKYLRFAFIL